VVGVVFEEPITRPAQMQQFDLGSLRLLDVGPQQVGIVALPQVRAHVGKEAGLEKRVDPLFEPLDGLFPRLIFSGRGPLKRLIFKRPVLQGSLHIVDGRAPLALDPRVDKVYKAAKALPNDGRILLLPHLGFDALYVLRGEVAAQVFLETLDVPRLRSLSELYLDDLRAVVEAKVLNGTRNGQPMNGSERVLLIADVVKQAFGLLILLDPP